MTRKGYKKLDAFRYANKLAHLVYGLTKTLPKEELFVLTSQMRRAALSVAANIVEGYAYATGKQKKHFYNIAFASLVELEYFLEFSLERKYITEAQYKQAEDLRSKAGKCLYGLLKSTK